MNQAFTSTSSHEHSLVPAPPPFAEDRLTMTFLNGTLCDVRISPVRGVRVVSAAAQRMGVAQLTSPRWRRL